MITMADLAGVILTSWYEVFFLHLFVFSVSFLLVYWHAVYLSYFYLFLFFIAMLVEIQLGVLEMSGMGLQAVTNPSEMFLTDHNTESDILAGLAIGVMVEGSRAFVIEVQVLRCHNFPYLNFFLQIHPPC